MLADVRVCLGCSKFCFDFPIAVPSKLGDVQVLPTLLC